MTLELFRQPAFWSAVAASFAAFSSFLLYRIHRLKLLDSVQPELVPTGWQVGRTRGEGDKKTTEIRFSSLRNVGRGISLNTSVTVWGGSMEAPTALGGGLRPGMIPPGEESSVDGRIHVWWRNALRVRDGPRRAFFELTIHSWDSRDIRHERIVHLLAIESPEHITAGAKLLAPGLYQTSVERRARSVRRLKLERWLSARVRQVQKGIGALVPRLPRSDNGSDKPGLK